MAVGIMIKSAFKKTVIPSTLFVSAFINGISYAQSSPPANWQGYAESDVMVVDVPSNDVLNVRTRPNYKSKKVGSLSANQIVNIVDTDTGGWVYIEVGSISGWVNSRYLKESNIEQRRNASAEIPVKKGSSLTSVKPIPEKPDTLSMMKLDKSCDQYFKIFDFDAHPDIKDLSIAAWQGNTDIQNTLGMMYENIEMPYNRRNECMAVYWLTKAGNQGHLPSQFELSEIYNRLYFSEQANFWFQKALDSGYPPAQFKTAISHKTNGDYKLALLWAERSANNGYAPAQHFVGTLYTRKSKVIKDWYQIDTDYELAVSWLRKSASQGYMDSELELGILFETGKGVKRDYKRAAELYKKAAYQNNNVAQDRLAKLFNKGTGVNKNLIEAYKWAHLSGLSSLKDSIEKKISALDIERAREAASQCRDSNYEICSKLN